MNECVGKNKNVAVFHCSPQCWFYKGIPHYVRLMRLSPLSSISNTSPLCKIGQMFPTMQD